MWVSTSELKTQQLVFKLHDIFLISDEYVNSIFAWHQIIAKNIGQFLHSYELYKGVYMKNNDLEYLNNFMLLCGQRELSNLNP